MCKHLTLRRIRVTGAIFMYIPKDSRMHQLCAAADWICKKLID